MQDIKCYLDRISPRWVLTSIQDSKTCLDKSQYPNVKGSAVIERECILVSLNSDRLVFAGAPKAPNTIAYPYICTSNIVSVHICPVKICIDGKMTNNPEQNVIVLFVETLNTYYTFVAQAKHICNTAYELEETIKIIEKMAEGI